MGKIYGYARCSTSEDRQDITIQIDKLKAAGADEIFFEYEHGQAPVKQNLQTLFDLVQPGDTILTVEVSRLSRSTQQLCQIIDTVKEKQICLCILGSITVDCRNGEMDAMTKAFLQISAVFCELEVTMLRARVKGSLQHAKAQGRKLGRPQTTKDDIPAIFYKHYPALIAGTMNVSELARLCNLSRPTVYKYANMLK